MARESDHEMHDHDRGLAFDIATLMNRRRALALIGGAGLATLVGCGSGSDSVTSAATTTAAGSTATTAGSTATTAGATATTAAASCSTAIPEETAGPYPGDGSNGTNVLTQSGVVRSDITSSFGSSSTVAQGIPMTVRLTVLSMSAGCVPLKDAAIYIWHCDREGRYSLYSQGVTSENYLRGVQVTGSDGSVTFKSIFPACYSGRWPHVHFEVYPSVDKITSARNKLRTSQLALPEYVCKVVYATDGYSQSVRNLSQVSLASDNVFSDGYSLQMATISGNVTSGYTASLVVPT
jgi:protocatechuate 3,4-dioxygenase beta subunit